VLDGGRRDQLMRSLLGLRIALTTLGVLGAIAFAAVAGYSHALLVGTALAGVGLIVQMTQNMLAVSLMVEIRVGWVTLLDVVRQVIQVTLVVVLVTAGAGLVPLLATSIPAAVVTLAATAILVRGHVPLRPSFAAAQWRALGRQVLPFAVATAVNVLYFRAAVVVTSLVGTAAEVGYFGASFRVIESIVVIPGLLVSTAFPIFSRAARDDRARFGYAVQRTYEACSALGGAIALGLALAAPFVISVVAGPKFAPAAGVLRIQALALAATFAAVTWGYALLSLHRHRALLIVNSAALAVAIVLTLILVKVDGARGAAIATVVGEAALGAVAALMLRTVSLGNLPRIAVAAALGACVAFTGLPAWAEGILGVATYAVVLWRIGGIPQEIGIELRRATGSLRAR
jgi:O-antigen/teichoic acid export membrane protein